MKRLGVGVLLLSGIGWVVWYGTGHYLGYRFAIGTWPVPSGTPWTYQLWSGFVPALTVATIFGSVISLYHIKNCHHDGCWRIGKHTVNGSPWCSKHQEEARPERTENEILLGIETQLIAQTSAIN